MDLHATDIIRAKGMVTVTKLPENGSGAQVPAGPGEWGISIHVFRIDGRAGIQEKLDSLFRTKGGGTVERSFGFGSTVSHEGARLYRWLCSTIGIGTMSEQNSDDVVVFRAIGFAKGCV